MQNLLDLKYFSRAVVITDAIYNFKQYKITEHIKGLRLQLASDGLSQQEQLELLAEQMAYEKIKQTFSEKLGRIIIK